MRRALFAMTVGAFACGSALAAQPELGGPMKHLLVFMPASEIIIDFESGLPDEVMTMQPARDDLTGAASTLNGLTHNAQYGWLAGGFISLPPGRFIWIEATDMTDGLEIYEQNTFAPIFGTDGSSSIWQWSGAMTHNWAAASEDGYYQAIFRTYVADASGAADPAFAPGLVRVQWVSGDAPVCPEDLTGDGVVGAADLAELLGQWLDTATLADLSGDFVVGAPDLANLLGSWGVCE